LVINFISFPNLDMSFKLTINPVLLRIRDIALLYLQQNTIVIFYLSQKIQKIQTIQTIQKIPQKSPKYPLLFTTTPIYTHTNLSTHLYPPFLDPYD